MKNSPDTFVDPLEAKLFKDILIEHKEKPERIFGSSMATALKHTMPTTELNTLVLQD